MFLHVAGGDHFHCWRQLYYIIISPIIHPFDICWVFGIFSNLDKVKQHPRKLTIYLTPQNISLSTRHISCTPALLLITVIIIVISAVPLMAECHQLTLPFHNPFIDTDTMNLCLLQYGLTSNSKEQSSQEYLRMLLPSPCSIFLSASVVWTSSGQPWEA